MRHVGFVAVIMLLAEASVSFGQSDNPEQAPPPEPPSGVSASGSPPVAGTAGPTASRQLPPPAPLPSPLAAPPLAPTAAPPPSVFSEAAFDSFVTRWWIGADYLLWWTKGDRLPPLVASGSPNDPMPGAPGQPGTQVLFGGDYDNSVRSGIRVRGGYWFTPDHSVGLDGTFFFVGGQSADFDAASDGVPVLTRPFFNVNSGRGGAFIVAFPNQQAGEVQADLSTQFWGADVNVRSTLLRGAFYQVNLLGGFRFLALHDALDMQENDTIAPNAPMNQQQWDAITDHFHTGNQFYGGQLGSDVMWSRGRFFIDLLGKVALGVSVEEAGINGWTAYGNAQSQTGLLGIGELALPSNSGNYNQSRFAVVPEGDLNFGYALSPHIRVVVGYTIIYWSSVFRAGDQVDRVINPSEFAAVTGQGPLIGPARPRFTFRRGDFWAQGLNFGVQLRF